MKKRTDLESPQLLDEHSKAEEMRRVLTRHQGELEALVIVWVELVEAGADAIQEGGIQGKLELPLVYVAVWRGNPFVGKHIHHCGHILSPKTHKEINNFKERRKKKEENISPT